jgi:hypothetical protein
MLTKGKKFILLIRHSPCYSYNPNVVGHHYTQSNTNNMNRTLALLPTTRDKHEWTIV